MSKDVKTSTTNNTTVSEINTDSVKIFEMEKLITKVEQTTDQKNFTDGEEIYKLKAYQSFDDLNLRQKLLAGIYGYGYSDPTSIQQIGIKPIIDGRDVIAQAQSGSGKTATFAIGMLQNIDPKLRKVQALVISPSGELAEQTRKVIYELGSQMKIKVHCSRGGKSIHTEKRALKNKAQVVVGTPGRILDLMKKRYLKTQHIQIIVIDEADQILNSNFSETIDQILNDYFGKSNAQVCLFSATMDPKFLEIAPQLVPGAVEILVDRKQLSLKGIKQYKVELKDEYKTETLIEILNLISTQSAMIFANRKQDVLNLAKVLTKDGFSVSYICGGLSKQEREKQMDDFQKSKTNILICTDILARGLDFQRLELVINYDLPRDANMYIHRIGRVGRHGRKGLNINFIAQRDVRTLNFIENLYGIKLNDLPNDLDTDNLY